MKKIPIQVLSEGISIGKAKLYHKKKFLIKRHTISEEEIQQELVKFEKIIEKVVADIDSIIENTDHSQENNDILSTHKMIIKDPELAKNVQRMVKNDHISLEKALENHFQQIISLFENMDNDYLAQRSSDYEDVAHRLLATILDSSQPEVDEIDKDSIIIAESVRPSDITKWYSQNVQGVCVERGSKNCHAAIIARSLSMPFVAGIQNIFAEFKNDDEVVIAGQEEKVIIKPDDSTLTIYQNLLQEQKQKQEALQEIVDIPARTEDGKKIKIMCNMEIPQELASVLSLKCHGVGLFRTEFLFMERNDLPSEEEQYQTYQKIAAAIQPYPFIIRTIDVGGDKFADSIYQKKEKNPSLGMRGIRISLADEKLFKTQIRAIIRANTYNNIKIMFPMISSVNEFRQAKKVVVQCLEDLKNGDIDTSIEIGTMIEIPSAAINADLLAKECDFFSIGTNDLIQYTLAVDRDNEKVTHYYKTNNVAVLRLIQNTVLYAKKQNIPVAVCGEMASQPEFIALLIGLGVEEISVSPGAYLTVKKRISEISQKKSIEKMQLIMAEINNDEVTI